MTLSRKIRAVHRAERAELLRTLRRWGPDAPTLCEAWSARRLAAHIVVAEQAAGVPLAVAYPVWRTISADRARGMQERFADTGERQMDKAEERGWDWLLGRLEGGPPRTFALPMIVGVRLVEEWIHHEDVRRGNGEPQRPMHGRLAEALVAGGLTIRRFDVFAASRRGIEVCLPDGMTFTVGTGEPVARVRGDAGEVTLWLAGRVSAANVEVEGDVPDAALHV